MAGVRVSDVISPLSPSDTYPVIDVDVNAKGFARAVASTAQRDAIPASLRSTSLFVLVTDTGTFYRWNGSAWVLVNLAQLALPANHQWNVIPTGTIDGVNRVFTLPEVPDPTNSLLLFKNGMLMRQGAGHDFVLSGATITFDNAATPQTGDNLLASYTYTN